MAKDRNTAVDGLCTRVHSSQPFNCQILRSISVINGLYYFFLPENKFDGSKSRRQISIDFVKAKYYTAHHTSVLESMEWWCLCCGLQALADWSDTGWEYNLYPSVIKEFFWRFLYLDGKQDSQIPVFIVWLWDYGLISVSSESIFELQVEVYCADMILCLLLWSYVLRTYWIKFGQNDEWPRGRD